MPSDNTDFQLGSDGETKSEMPTEWTGKPKKKGASRWRRAAWPISGCSVLVLIIVLTSLVTMLATGVVDPNDYEWFRRLCIATLSSNKVAFATGKSDQVSSLVLFDLDAKRSCILVNKRPFFGGVAWSPDGKQILYENPAPPTQISVIDADGTHDHIVATSARGGLWSPDGRHILFQRILPSTLQNKLVEMDNDGSNLHELITDVNDYEWTADSRSIMFTTIPTGGRSVYLIDIDGSNQRQIAGGASPRLAPDGQHIAFMTSVAGGAVLTVARLDGSDAHQIENVPIYSNLKVEWSPDSKHIAFIVVKTNPNPTAMTYQIYIAHADGSGTYALIPEGRSVSPTWSPDSNSIAFVQRDPGSAQVLYIVNSDGSNSHKIFDAPYIQTSAQWCPTSRIKS